MTNFGQNWSFLPIFGDFRVKSVKIAKKGQFWSKLAIFGDFGANQKQHVHSTLFSEGDPLKKECYAHAVF